MEEEEEDDVEMVELDCYDILRGAQDGHHVDDEVVFMEKGWKDGVARCPPTTTTENLWNS